MGDRLAGKVAIVTGAGSGMGFKIMELFLAESAKVIAVDIDKKIIEIGEKFGSNCIGVLADVTLISDVKDMVNAAVSSFGGLDVLCNNVGIDGELTPFIDCTEDNFQKVMDVNLKSVFLCMKAAIPEMLDGGSGSIINIASVAGFLGVPNCAAYAASKGGVIQLTRTAALEYAKKNVRINAICPGGIDTPMHDDSDDYSKEALAKMTPAGRLGTTSEIASTAVFLASDECAFMTGSLITCDGGYHAM